MTPCTSEHVWGPWYSGTYRGETVEYRDCQRCGAYERRGA